MIRTTTLLATGEQWLQTVSGISNLPLSQASPLRMLALILTTAAINLIRLNAFLEGKKTAKTLVSRFAALAPVELAG